VDCFAVSRLRAARTAIAIIAQLPLCALAAEFAPLQQIAPGVFVQRGADQAPSTANRGAVANLGVLVGTTGVIVVNTGSSAAHGAALLAAVARLTDRPVVLAIDTQASPDQVLGNVAFRARGIPVLAHRATDGFMHEHCDSCIADVKATADNDALDATKVAWPSRLIDGSQSISAGGRMVRILYFGWAERPGSLAVLDPKSGVLFAGNLASFEVVPQTHLGRLDNWIAALGELQDLAPAIVVPGHGPPGPSAQLAQMRGYLQGLLDGVRAAYQRGDGLMETVEGLQLPEYRGWALYDSHHRRNVHFAYLLVEQEDLQK